MKTISKTFEVTSGRVTFGDPCYPTNDCAKARKGPWTAHVVTGDEGAWGERVKHVIVHHVDFNPGDPRLTSRGARFPVDSGQAGVFDEASYGGDEFYDLCCKATLSKRQWGYVRGGVAFSSGYGDGVYEAQIHRLDGLAVCVELTFIEDE